MSILSVSNLNVWFKQGTNQNCAVHAVRDLSFSLAEGECLAIVGESGCGKSASLMSLLDLNGNHAHRSGEIIYKQQALHDFSEQHMRNIRGKEIAMISQDAMSALNPTMTIGAQIAEALKNRKNISQQQARKQVLQLLIETGISEPERRITQYPFEFSGGMLQRVMIAIALAGEPSVLLADEPTTALDASIQKQIIELIKNIQKQRQMALILVSHDLALVSQIADRIIVMYAGEAVEVAKATDLFKQPQHPYTQALLASLPKLSKQKNREKLHVIEGHPPDLSQPIAVCAFADRCDKTMHICAREKPPLFEQPAHWNRCWLAHLPA